MSHLTVRPRSIIAAVGIVLALAACDDVLGEPQEPQRSETPGEPATSPPAPAPGVGDDPCPGSSDPDRGCIHLGTLADRSPGTGQLTDELLAGQRDFWQRINDAGGIAGRDVHLADHVVDVGEDAQEQFAAYEELEEEVLALATLPGDAVADEVAAAMDADDVLGVAGSWWSGWHAPPAPTVLAAPSSHCLEAMLALDWYAAEVEQPAGVMAVSDAARYGDDVAAGAGLWAERSPEVRWAGHVEFDPDGDEAAVDAAVQAVLRGNADVVQLGVPAREAAVIVRKAAAHGFDGSFIGGWPSWHADLLDDPESAQALQALYHHVAPWDGLEADSAAHSAMRAAVGEAPPDSHAYLAGWISSYPLLAALQRAADTGELTRTTLREAVTGMNVDFEGARPPLELRDGRPDVVPFAVISRPDPAAELQLASWGQAPTDGLAAELAHPADCAGPIPPPGGSGSDPAGP